MPNIGIEVIVPRQLFNTPQLKRAIKNAQKGVAKDTKIDFDVTTQTWNNRPEFKIEEKNGGKTIIVSTRSEIYFYLDGGTRVRYATMTPNFKAKTSPGLIRSRQGAGGVMYIRRDRPRPGIKPRKFAEVIAKKWAKLYPKVMQRAIDAELS